LRPESSFKAFAINDTSEEESDDDDDDSDEEDDELSLITRKITKMWKSKNSSKFNSLFKRSFHKKEEIPIVCYECKKSGHFKSECPNLEKSKDKKKKLFKSIKKSLMSTWEELDNSSSNEDTEEEANMCLMAYAPTSEAKPALDAGTDDEDPHPDDTINSDGEEVIFISREDLIKGYNQLVSASARISKAYRKLNKHFQHLERENFTW